MSAKSFLSWVVPSSSAAAPFHTVAFIDLRYRVIWLGRGPGTRAWVAACLHKVAWVVAWWGCHTHNPRQTAYNTLPKWWEGKHSWLLPPLLVVFHLSWLEVKTRMNIHAQLSCLIYSYRPEGARFPLVVYGSSLVEALCPLIGWESTARQRNYACFCESENRVIDSSVLVWHFGGIVVF